MSEWKHNLSDLSKFVVLRWSEEGKYERHIVPDAHTVECFDGGYLFRDNEGRMVAHYRFDVVAGFERRDHARLAFTATFDKGKRPDRPADQPDDSEEPTP